jgi:putative transposase
MLKYKSDNTGIKFVLTEESYTSKVDHLALEELTKHESYLGKRVKRGLFRSLSGKLLNADINGAIGILRKVNAISDEQLMLLRNRGDGVSPKRLVKVS